MKEIVKAIIELLKEELASVHQYTDCGCSPSDGCLDGTISCYSAYKCSHSYKLEQQLNELIIKLEAMND